jgi:transposase, IS30 family
MSYAHITRQERYVISHLKIAGFSIREIGRRLGRSHSTIIRELRRNRSRADHVYWYEYSERVAQERRHKARCYRRQDTSELVKYVEDKITQEWSPEQIAAKVRLDYPGDASMRISVETIYRWVYMVAQSGGELHKHLRRSHKWRRRQKRYGAGKRFISGRVDIEERPAEAESREQFGHWEGDSVVGKLGKTRIATHVERKSRYLIAGILEDRTAAAFKAKTVNLFGKVDPCLRKTLTLDNGSEGARFKEIEKETGLSVYFAKPYAAWQRGTNENTNGLLRQYFPKGTDFNKVSEAALQWAVDRLNNRPRKCLNYRTPYEIFSEALGGALAK